MSLRNATALITGGARGFGKSFARVVLEAGGKVGLTTDDIINRPVNEIFSEATLWVGMNTTKTTCIFHNLWVAAVARRPAKLHVLLFDLEL